MRLSNKYSDIAADLGLTKVDEAEAKAFSVTPKTAISGELVISLRINYRRPNGKRGAADIYCPIHKIYDAIQTVYSKKWGDGTITSCGQKKRVRYY